MLVDGFVTFEQSQAGYCLCFQSLCYELNSHCGVVDSVYFQKYQTTPLKGLFLRFSSTLVVWKAVGAFTSPLVTSLHMLSWKDKVTTEALYLYHKLEKTENWLFHKSSWLLLCLAHPLHSSLSANMKQDIINQLESINSYGGTLRAGYIPISFDSPH